MSIIVNIHITLSDTCFDKYSDIFSDILWLSVIYLAAYLTNILNNPPTPSTARGSASEKTLYSEVYSPTFFCILSDIYSGNISAIYLDIPQCPMFYSYLTCFLTYNLRFYRAYVLTSIFASIWHMVWHCKSGNLSGISVGFGPARARELANSESPCRLATKPAMTWLARKLATTLQQKRRDGTVDTKSRPSTGSPKVENPIVQWMILG